MNDIGKDSKKAPNFDYIKHTIAQQENCKFPQVPVKSDRKVLVGYQGFLL